MLAGRSFIIFIGVFCVMEGFPVGLLYQRFTRNGKHGREVVEIFYNGVEPPICDKAVCEPITDDAELTEYLRKSVIAGNRGPPQVLVHRDYTYSQYTTVKTISDRTPTFHEEQPRTEEEPTTTEESLFISQEEEEEEEEWDRDNIY